MQRGKGTGHTQNAYDLLGPLVAPNDTVEDVADSDPVPRPATGAAPEVHTHGRPDVDTVGGVIDASAHPVGEPTPRSGVGEEERQVRPSPPEPNMSTIPVDEPKPADRPAVVTSDPSA